MENLEIYTKRGKQSLAWELEAYALFEKKFTGFTIKHTNKKFSEPFDGRICKENRITSIVETKCRVNVNYAEFLKRYNMTWLITDAKLQRIAQEIIKMINPVALYGFLYFPADKILLVKRLIDKDGEILKRTVKMSKTTLNCNGGATVGLNSFIDMNNALHIT